jgi:hypothetical protein
MKRTLVKVAVSLLAFAVGVSATYLLWLAHYGSRPLLHPWACAQVVIHTEIAEPELKVNERRATSIEEEWKELTDTEFCFLGRQHYSPPDESENAASDSELGGQFNPYGWLPSLRKDLQSGVAFLIRQLPDRTQTKAHVCPLHPALKGELAVYCLQHILKVNWYDLQASYKTRYDNINYEYSNSQDLLRKIIGSKKGARAMMNLWTKYYEQHTPAQPVAEAF